MCVCVHMCTMQVWVIEGKIMEIQHYRKQIYYEGKKLNCSPALQKINFLPVILSSMVSVFQPVSPVYCIRIQHFNSFTFS